jgi:hypothetical protein
MGNYTMADSQVKKLRVLLIILEYLTYKAYKKKKDSDAAKKKTAKGSGGGENEDPKKKKKGGPLKFKF